MPKHARTIDPPQRDKKRTPQAKRTTIERKRARTLKYDTRKAGR